MSAAHRITADRLFAGCILAHGKHDNLFAGRNSVLMAMSWAELDRWLEDRGEPEHEEQRHQHVLFAEVVAEVKVWKLIERVRQASKKPRRKVRAKGGAA